MIPAIQIQRPSLPLIVGLNLNSEVMIVPIAKFNTIIEGDTIFDNFGYSMNGVAYEYGVWYNYDSSLKEWLDKQGFSK